MCVSMPGSQCKSLTHRVAGKTVSVIEHLSYQLYSSFQIIRCPVKPEP